jgi:hypothetical protein
MSIVKSNLPVLHAEEFTNGDGWHCERIVYDVPKHDVQIVRYNGDDSAVVVKVDQDAAQMPLSRANSYIRSRI